jgi:glutamate formiminotransferase
MVLECVVNIAEGRDDERLARLVECCGADLLDVHRDPHHHRSVFTLVGEEAPRRLAAGAVQLIDLAAHRGVHPRIGVVDVVPFVALDGSTSADALAARDRFCAWAADELMLPCFRYGPERTLPEVRRDAFATLVPDCGPPHPHPTAGACAVGVRPPLVAYNVWVSAPDLPTVRRVAAAVRRPALRTLGLKVGDRFQVSCNLVAPDELGPAEATALVDEAGRSVGALVEGCELVGLVPRSVLDRIDPAEWSRLDLAADRTIEARIRAAGR